MAAAAASCLPGAATHLLLKPHVKLSRLAPAPGPEPKPRKSWRGTCAVFGGGDGSKDKRKFITKEQEPEEYWQSAAEREGKGPMSTLLPYIVIFGFLTPFVILALGFTNGWIKIPVR